MALFVICLTEYIRIRSILLSLRIYENRYNCYDMTREHAQSFIQRMKSDIAFKVHVTSLEDIHERIEFINSEGYTCTEEEIKHAEAMANSDVGQRRGGYWFVFSYINRYRL